MASDEVALIIKRIKNHYSNYKMDKDLTDEWIEQLSKYQWEDVNERLTKHLGSEDADKFPKLYVLLKGLKTIEELDEDNQEHKIECHICRRFINKKEYEKHFDRCSSVNYILRQIKKYRMNNIDKSFLWKLTDEEFDIRYKKFLRKIQELTTDENEKKRIEFIFNPPSREEAQKFINKKENN